MKTDNNRGKSFINKHFISVMALISLVVMTPSLTSLEQQSFGQQQETNNTATSTTASASNQSAAASSSANVTAAEGPGSVLKLSQANIALDIPMMRGYENGNEIFFIATDASDNQTAAQLMNATGFKVNFAPLLARTPEEARGQAYVFENGIAGEGPLGFQLPVINARPGQEGYSPLLQINLVRWNEGAAARPTELRSEQDIIAASNAGQLTITKTDVIVNHPAVKWQGGS